MASKPSDLAWRLMTPSPVSKSTKCPCCAVHDVKNVRTRSLNSLARGLWASRSLSPT